MSRVYTVWAQLPENASSESVLMYALCLQLWRRHLDPLWRLRPLR